MDALEVLNTRASQAILDLPVPSEEQLMMLFSAALRAPDHANLKPSRFIIVEEERREAFGDLLAKCVKATEPDVDDAKFNKTKSLPLRAPMVIVAITKYQEHPKVPRVEQIVSTGAAVQNIMLGLHAMGFAGYWRTGTLASNTVLKDSLKLEKNDEIVGFIYLGTATREKSPRDIPDLSQFVSKF